MDGDVDTVAKQQSTATAMVKRCRCVTHPFTHLSCVPQRTTAAHRPSCAGHHPAPAHARRVPRRCPVRPRDALLFWRHHPIRRSPQGGMVNAIHLLRLGFARERDRSITPPFAKQHTPDHDPMRVEVLRAYRFDFGRVHLAPLRVIHVFRGRADHGDTDDRDRFTAAIAGNQIPAQG